VLITLEAVYLFDMNSYAEIQEMSLATVGLTFLWSAIAKLMSRNDFKMTLWQIPYMPPALIPAVHLLLPPIEIGIAIGLICGQQIAKVAAIALLLSFCLLAIVVVKAKLKINCNCFGSGDRSFSGWTILQNLGLSALVCLGMPVKQPETIPLDLFVGAIFLVAGLSAATVLNNRKLVGELRRLKIIR
jgi:hypothetical protein